MDLVTNHLPRAQPQLFGAEALMEMWLRDAPDARLPSVIRSLHGWAMQNSEKGFYHLAKYFDQEPAEIGHAIALFRRHRRKLCKPPQGRDCAQLHLYLLYDCLIHVGSLQRKVRTIGYLDEPPRKQASHRLPDIADDPAWFNRILNYVVINGVLKIHDKRYYHSELSDGAAVTYAGELALIRTGNRPTILVNNQSGHYRPDAADVHIAMDLVEHGLSGLAGEKRRVMLVQGALVNHLPELKPKKLT